ncbi:MAG: phosphoribosylaminoimidazolesuccinocarboxamide synthase, partial [Chloroflexota bacterium]|nr:phosphoribosylaminoimidazolesuccinocarboxamide synthase [Chloroflexota bacterium]
MTLASAFVRSGKVRDLYALADERLLLVASDRLSAFDIVLPTPIPDKGKVLTGLSRFWFAQTAGIVPNHLLGTDPRGLEGAGGPSRGEAADLRGRAMICRRAEVLPVEVIVRGYL